MGMSASQERYERPAALQEAVFQRLFEQAEIAKFNQQELYDYRESQKNFWDWNAVTETAEKKGRAEGLVEGEKKGRYEVARNLIAMHLPINSIIQATGLSKEEITSLM